MIGKLFSHSFKCHKWIIHGFKFQASKYSAVLHQDFPLQVIASDVFAGQGSAAHSKDKLCLSQKTTTIETNKQEMWFVEAVNYNEYVVK